MGERDSMRAQSVAKTRVLVVNDSLSKKNSTAIKKKPISEYMDLLEKSGLLKKRAMIEAHSEKFVDFRSTQA